MMCPKCEEKMSAWDSEPDPESIPIWVCDPCDVILEVDVEDQQVFLGWLVEFVAAGIRHDAELYGAQAALKSFREVWEEQFKDHPEMRDMFSKPEGNS